MASFESIPGTAKVRPFFFIRAAGLSRTDLLNGADIAHALHDAFTMPASERRARHEKLMRWVEKHTAAQWGENFVRVRSHRLRM